MKNLILEEKIFSIASEDEFNEVALEIFDLQFNNNPLYRSYTELIGKQNPKTYKDIPFLPISFFKNHDIIHRDYQPELIFYSSGTTTKQRSKHFIAKKKLYEQSFTTTYKNQIGDPENQIILALLPNYLEQGHSSLVYMVQELITLTKNKYSGFILNDLQSAHDIYLKAIRLGKQVVIFGVAYALLDLASLKMDFSQAIIIETGGMKGRRKEMLKNELHNTIAMGLNTTKIKSEYGMTELLSQSYSINSDIKFSCPKWMKILIRSTNDPFQYVIDGKTGGINVIDLANLYSCSFIETQDLGRIYKDEFEIMGRFDYADIRGCNLMVE
jgi:hypothetical protein